MIYGLQKALESLAFKPYPSPHFTNLQYYEYHIYEEIIYIRIDISMIRNFFSFSKSKLNLYLSRYERN